MTTHYQPKLYMGQEEIFAIRRAITHVEFAMFPPSPMALDWKPNPEEIALYFGHIIDAIDTIMDKVEGTQ